MKNYREYLSRLVRVPDVSWMGVIAIIFLTSLVPLVFVASRNAVKNSAKNAQNIENIPTKNPINIQNFSPEPEKIDLWQIHISYDGQKFAYHGIKKTFGYIPDFRLSKDLSPFSIEMLSSGDEVFSTPVHINTLGIAENFQNNSAELIKNMSTMLYIPYKEEVDKIVIKEKDKEILSISIPRKITEYEIKKVYADIPSEKINGPLVVAVINDGYLESGSAGEERFKADIRLMTDRFNEVKPYEGKVSSLFKFIPIYQKKVFNCVSYLTCLTFEKQKEIQSVQNAAGAVRYIVLSDYLGGSWGGVISDIGGDLVVITSKQAAQNNEGTFVFRAHHEFLGHSVGFLHDRYLYNAENGEVAAKALKEGRDPKSNCTDNPNGENFWKQVSNRSQGEKNAVGGCYTNTLFQPNIPNCDSFKSETMMDSKCAKNMVFDAVEQYWIKENILSKITVSSENVSTNTTKKCSDITGISECNALSECLYMPHVGCREGDKAKGEMCNEDGTNKEKKDGVDPNMYCRQGEICDTIPKGRIPALETELNQKGQIFPVMCISPNSISNGQACNSNSICIKGSYCSNNVCCSIGSVWDATEKKCIQKANASLTCIACENLVSLWNACEENAIYTFSVRGKFENNLCVYQNPTKTLVKSCDVGTTCVNQIGNTERANAPECLPLQEAASCGTAGNKCCGTKSACISGLECNGGFCTEVCGGAGQKCCVTNDESKKCDFPNLSCQGEICREVCAVQ